MITATPNGKVLNVQVDQRAITYIAAENPRIGSVFIGHIPESTVRQSFSITDMFDGTVADEYLKYDCDHIILTRKQVGTTVQFEGLKIRLTNSATGNRFEVGEYLPHAEVVKLNTEKPNGVTIHHRYSDLANDAKAEETRRAYFKAIAAAVIFE